jgi:hypothetical protein
LGNFNTNLFNSQLFGGLSSSSTSGATQVSEIIYAAYRNCGILKAPQRGYSNSEWQDGVEALNTLLDAWGIDPLKIYTVRFDDLTLVQGGQRAYTIGIDPTGQQIADYPVPRPVRIHAANIIVQLSGGPALRVPMELLNVDGWSNIRVQNVPTTIPIWLYCDYASSPFANLYFYPYPAGPGQLELYSWQQFQKFVNPSDAVLLPPGYLRALKFNLAVELAARNPTRAILTPATAKIAEESLADIMRRNAPSPLMSCDPALTTFHRGTTWQYTTGDYGKI